MSNYRDNPEDLPLCLSLCAIVFLWFLFLLGIGMLYTAKNDKDRWYEHENHTYEEQLKNND